MADHTIIWHPDGSYTLTHPDDCEHVEPCPTERAVERVAGTISRGEYRVTIDRNHIRFDDLHPDTPPEPEPEREPTMYGSRQYVERHDAPRLVDAMRLDPGTDNWKDVCDWIHAYAHTRGLLDLDGSLGAHEGHVTFGNTITYTARPGDWVVLGTAGRTGEGSWSAMSDEAFQRRYCRPDEVYLAIDGDVRWFPATAGIILLQGDHDALAHVGESILDYYRECGIPTEQMPLIVLTGPQERLVTFPDHPAVVATTLPEADVERLRADFSDASEAAGRPAPIVVHADRPDEMIVLDDQMMRDDGWCRIDESLVRRIVDAHDGPCMLDHDGACQSHDFGDPCPIPLIRATLG